MRGGSVVPVWEQDLILRLGTALLREDVAGLRSQAVLLPASTTRVAGRFGRPHSTSSRTLALPTRTASGGIGMDAGLRPSDGGPDLWLAHNRLRIPVRLGSPERGDLVSDLVMRQPRVLRVHPSRRRSEAARLGSVVRVLEAELMTSVAPELVGEFRAGFRALQIEARAAAESAQARKRLRPKVFGRLRGDTSWLAAESLAAHRDHPIYPLSIARVGVSASDLPRWAPEHAPRFGLRWVCVPAEHVAMGGELPNWWPGGSGPGQTGLDAVPPPGHVALPIHPALASQLTPVMTDVPWQPLSAPQLQVRPTLSMRTVVPEADPSVHLKVPLPMRTLGRLNLRLVSRASLADGAVLTRGLRTLLSQDEQFRDTVLTADESTWLHADNHLAILIRRWPSWPNARVVPVAGLTVRRWDGRMPIEQLAQEFFGGDLDAFLDAYLRTLLAWQITLWLKYGIVHEAHPQNVLVVVDRPGSVPRIRLLLRDLDSCLVDPELAGSLVEADDLTDRRLIAKDPVDLAAMFVTTTLHQCVASVLIETAIGVVRPVAPLLARIRPLLVSIADAHQGARDTELFTSEIVRAERLPVKRTLTAATLLPKSRTGAVDVNKFYGADAPTYL